MSLGITSESVDMIPDIVQINIQIVVQHILFIKNVADYKSVANTQ